MSPKENTTIESLKKKMLELKAANILPRGYGEIIAEELGVDKNRAYEALFGKTANVKIMEAIIALATDNREIRLLKKVTELLED